MKKFLSLFIVLCFVFLTACGTSTLDAAEGSVPAADNAEPNATASPAETEDQSEQVDMLYYKKIGDNSLMAACYTDEGIDLLGQDYYVIHAGEAVITNAEGETVSLDELTRGCPVRITFPGMVMSSYPGQINATSIQALSNEADPSVPPEDEIEPIVDGGAKWWEEEPVKEIPRLGVEYVTSDFSAYATMHCSYGSWNYTAEDGSGVGTDSCGASNTMLDGQEPSDWEFDEEHTIKRSGFNIITLSTSVDAASITVKAYAVDAPEKVWVDVELTDDGELKLPDGNCVFEVKAEWNSDQYQGDATYYFLVTEA